ncbi:transcriptional regulator GcvA [Afifella marina]|uniref:LysR family transcriptional regulator, glycine cleavage system transcriptional activator n=1 Tax=Afifella marina DSM 2698 TaxID=1120955 RepID=A0A1G5NQF9_AFIMA|nr:transcriptional regulator GcvA [Afifella marina]MBK1624694.1 transcriptional regulator GcvA [Afifella marina DSM 2698]MBK1627369.1 transcriptional regulator GcvA [Afifella marina]MBK5915865.1 LysR family transcriptional regulator [Afifella marina]RAI20591.1 LysR family transcriptional regulator [Afifella marina DSM 2698]SCZ39612.1 LysR family transcriptional regulator, glycine cleavage system transcriptional activator [Afifella marina DSM 2698]
MPLSLPPVTAIRVFEAASRHLNFTAAAEELAMTQAAVSYQIKLLEERLGTHLFVRRARGVELTEAGARLAPAVQRAFDGLRESFSALATSNEGILSVSAVITFAATWLVPRLGIFQLAHPEIAVRLETSNHFTNFARDAVDVGVRAGRGDWPGLTSHKLRDIAFSPMMSPALAARLGPAPKPEDLLDLPLIDPSDSWWTDWFRLAGIEAGDIEERSGLHLLSQHLAARAAIAGQGVAILEPAFFREEMAAGRLVQPFPLAASSNWAYYLVYPETRRPPRKVRAFRDWIVSRLQEEAALRPERAAADAPDPRMS